MKFADGPAKGIEKDYPKECQTVRYYSWTYENSHRRDGDFWLFVKRPKNKVNRHILRMVTAAREGRDPRLDPVADPARVISRGRNAPCWCGSGKKYKKCHAAPQL